MLDTVQAHETSGVYVSAISLVEVAQAFSRGSMFLPIPPQEWFAVALAYPGVRLVPIDPAIATEAYNLPEPFHKDPADRLIVATARVLDLPLLTADDKIRAYPHVRLAL